MRFYHILSVLILLLAFPVSASPSFTINSPLSASHTILNNAYLKFNFSWNGVGSSSCIINVDGHPAGKVNVTSSSSSVVYSNRSFSLGNNTWNISCDTSPYLSSNYWFVLDYSAVDDNFSSYHQISKRLNLTANDLGSNIIVGKILTNPSHGTIINNYDGTVNYTGFGNFSGADSFKYELISKGNKAFNGTNHYYEYVNVGSSITWNNAKNSASTRKLNGLTGYLVTITSLDENTFILQKIGSNSWIGASDSASEGVWKWVTGPESGTQFWQGTGASGSVIGGLFNRWESGEPNNAGDEDYGEFYYGNGKWNDLPDSGGINGYIVEYGGIAGDIVQSSNATVTILVNVPPDLDGDGVIDFSDTLIGNSSSISGTGIASINVSIGGRPTNGSFSGKKEIVFRNGTNSIMNFTFNFSKGTLNLSRISVKLAENSLIVDLSNQLQNANKTLYLKNKDFVKLCVKDKDISSISEVSSGCNGANETDFSDCLNNATGMMRNGIFCRDNGTIIVSNLRHSAILGTPKTTVPPSIPETKHSSSGTVAICGDGKCISFFESCSVCPEDCGACESGERSVSVNDSGKGTDSVSKKPSEEMPDTTDDTSKESQMQSTAGRSTVNDSSASLISSAEHSRINSERFGDFLRIAGFTVSVLALASMLFMFFSKRRDDGKVYETTISDENVFIEDKTSSTGKYEE